MNQPQMKSVASRAAMLPSDRTPPQAIDAERAVLSAALQSPDSLGTSMEILKPDDFYVPRHRAVYEAMISLSERGEPTDLITLADHLEKSGELEKIGGPAELDAMLDVAASPANVSYHARIVRQRSLLREIILVSHSTAKEAYEGADGAEDILDRAQSDLFSLAQAAEKKGFRPLKELANLTFQHIQEAYQRGGELTGVPTGFTDLDKLTGGMQPSDLVILAGRPSMGKTAVALNLACNAAMGGSPVGFFSLEMSSEQLVTRLISSIGGFDNHAIRTGRLKPTDWPRLTEALGRLTKLPVYIDDSSSITVLELRSKARRMAQLHGVKTIIVDYLQLMSSHGRVENRQQEISQISRSLKALAKDLDVTVLALSQLSRAVESRGGDHRPMLSDLRESGAIEQDADMVVFVYRQEYYEQDNPEVANLAELIIAKQRNGPIGTVKLHFDRRFTRFSNLSRDNTADQYAPPSRGAAGPPPPPIPPPGDPGPAAPAPKPPRAPRPVTPPAQPAPEVYPDEPSSDEGPDIW
jgi:replicative DNA helicase